MKKNIILSLSVLFITSALYAINGNEYVGMVLLPGGNEHSGVIKADGGNEYSGVIGTNGGNEYNGSMQVDGGNSYTGSIKTTDNTDKINYKISKLQKARNQINKQLAGYNALLLRRDELDLQIANEQAKLTQDAIPTGGAQAGLPHLYDLNGTHIGYGYPIAGVIDQTSNLTPGRNSGYGFRLTGNVSESQPKAVRTVRPAW